MSTVDAAFTVYALLCIAAVFIIATVPNRVSQRDLDEPAYAPLRSDVQSSPKKYAGKVGYWLFLSRTFSTSGRAATRKQRTRDQCA